MRPVAGLPASGNKLKCGNNQVWQDAIVRGGRSTNATTALAPPPPACVGRWATQLAEGRAHARGVPPRRSLTTQSQCKICPRGISRGIIPAGRAAGAVVGGAPRAALAKATPHRPQAAPPSHPNPTTTTTHSPVSHSVLHPRSDSLHRDDPAGVAAIGRCVGTPAPRHRPRLSSCLLSVRPPAPLTWCLQCPPQRDAWGRRVT